MYAINIKQRGGRKKDTAVNVIFRFYYDIDDNTGSSRSSTTADINTIVGCNVWGKRERETVKKRIVKYVHMHIILNASAERG